MARPARAFELLRAHGDGGDSWAVLREVRRKTRCIRAFAFARRPGILAPSLALALRAAAARPGLDPGAFAFAILQTQSRSDIWDSVTYAFGCRRAGSRFRGDDDKKVDRAFLVGYSRTCDLAWPDLSHTKLRHRRRHVRC